MFLFSQRRKLTQSFHGWFAFVLINYYWHVNSSSLFLVYLFQSQWAQRITRASNTTGGKTIYQNALVRSEQVILGSSRGVLLFMNILAFLPSVRWIFVACSFEYHGNWDKHLLSVCLGLGVGFYSICILWLDKSVTFESTRVLSHERFVPCHFSKFRL